MMCLSIGIKINYLGLRIHMVEILNFQEPPDNLSFKKVTSNSGKYKENIKFYKAK